MLTIDLGASFDDRCRQETFITVRCESQVDPRGWDDRAILAIIDCAIHSLPSPDEDSYINLTEDGIVCFSGLEHGDGTKIEKVAFKEFLLKRLKEAEWHQTLRTGQFWCQFDALLHPEELLGLEWCSASGEEESEESEDADPE